MGGTPRPSSNTERLSAEKIEPPTSEAWAMIPVKATSSPSRNTGVAIEKSGRWPVPIHGSFVITTSPGFHVSGGNRRRKCFTVRDIVPTNDGIDPLFSASVSPLRSIRTQA